MAEWVAGCFRLLDPLVAALARYVIAAEKLHADVPRPGSSTGTGVSPLAQCIWQRSGA